MKGLVSVIIPTRGDRPSLWERALRSVMSQTLLPGEVIVVCDSEERVELPSYDLPVEVLGGVGQRGVSAARNTGAAYAKGKFLAFLDDDDAWKPDYLSRVFKEGEQIDVILAAFEKHRPQDIKPEKIPPEKLEKGAFLVANPGLRGSNLVIRRAIYVELGGFDESLPALEDMDFGIKLSMQPGLRYRRITESLVEYHSHTGPRLTTAKNPQIEQGARLFLQRYRASMSEEKRDQYRERALRLWGVEL